MRKLIPILLVLAAIALGQPAAVLFIGQPGAIPIKIPCVLTGSPTAGYVLTATSTVGQCDWETVGGASVSADTIKNAIGITDGGSANTITGTTTTAFPGAYAAKQVVTVLMNATNTGATTININSLGAKAVTKEGSTALAAGNLVSGQEYLMVYDGTRFQALNYTRLAADIPTLNQSTTGNAATATALAANPANCSAGNLPRGVDASGVAEGCAAVNLATETTGAAPTATALAANPTETGCSATTPTTVTAIDASGNLTCTSIQVATNSVPGILSAADHATFAAGGGAPVTRTVVSFSATPVFPRSTQLQIWEITLTGNVTSSTTSGLAAGDVLFRKICQDGTGSRTFVEPTGFSAAAVISPTLSICTQQSFWWDGSAAIPITNGITSEAGDFGPESAAPATPASGTFSCWSDSTDHNGKSCKANNSASIFKMVLAGVDINPITGQVTATHLSSALPVNQGGTGTASTLTGIMRGNASAMTAAELSGDAATSGSNAVVVSKVNGVSQAASPATDSIPIVTASNTRTDKVIPDCPSNALGYTQSTHAFGCNTITGGSGGGTVVSKTVDYSAQASDSASALYFNGTTKTYTLLSTVPTMPWIVTVCNINSTALTIARGTATINGGSSNISLPQFQCVTIESDTATGGNNYVSNVPFAVTAPVTLTPAANVMTFACATCVTGTPTNHGVAVGSATQANGYTAVGATNTLLHGNTGADPTYSAIVNADITNATIDLTTKVTGLLPTANMAANPLVRSFGATFVNGGSALVAGATSYFTVPFACTITAWNITADAGTVTFDIWKIATGTAIPTISNTIVASAFPALATGTAIHSTTLTAWTTSVTANDIVGVNLKTVATATQATLTVQCNAT